MRLPIAHQLSLLLAAAVILSVLAVGGAGLWSLRQGFADYLRQRDEAQLEQLVILLQRRAAGGGLEALRGDHAAFRAVMDEVLGRPPRIDPPPPRDPSRPMPPGPPGGPGPRVVVFDVQGQPLAGRPLPPGVPRIARLVQWDGVDVARVEMAVDPRPAGLDARFLRHQTLVLTLAALVTVVVALLAAWAVAARWSRPLRELQQAARRIAGGDKTAQVASLGAGRSGTLEIDQLAEDVNSMAVSLAALDDTRRQWIAQISHELRTPLAVLRGELEAIEDGMRSPTPALLASLGAEVRQLNRLVDDLHTLSVADMGRLPCTFSDGDADAQLRRIAERFLERASDLGLTLDLPAKGAPLAARWDFGRIAQLLGNLLENSLRYTQSPGRIRVDWQIVEARMHLRVEDSAPGVAPADMARLFQPLFRVDAVRSRTGAAGSGLGLSVARAIATAHRGVIRLENSSLGGLAVCVDLPLQPQYTERRQGGSRR